VKVGIVLPQGLQGEYAGWQPERAWERTVEVAGQAERHGFESVWVYDHFHTMPLPTRAISFESFAVLAALAPLTTSVRLGQLVMCSAFRNPSLAAKMLSTLDVISGGRVELGIGAGWKQDEWEAYGYGFPATRERMGILADSLEVITRMFELGSGTYEGKHASVRGAINEPAGVQQPRIPIMVGGNGPVVTWRLAARHADELNLDGMPPADVEAALPVIAQRCEEHGRDPATLKVSVNLWSSQVAEAGPKRTELLGAYRDLGLARAQCLVTAAAEGDEALDALFEDCTAAGIEFEGRPS
jgi:F420-dependent oxidoreductase-like protein